MHAGLLDPFTLMQEVCTASHAPPVVEVARPSTCTPTMEDEWLQLKAHASQIIDCKAQRSHTHSSHTAAHTQSRSEATSVSPPLRAIPGPRYPPPNTIRTYIMKVRCPAHLAQPGVHQHALQLLHARHQPHLAAVKQLGLADRAVLAQLGVLMGREATRDAREGKGGNLGGGMWR